jgi:hypothetical protein
MTTDFKATQVQTNKIIVTGSFAGDGSNQLLIYNYAADDSGSPNQGQIDPTKFDTTSGIGSDVFLFVSGGVATRGTGGSYGVTVIGGDLHVSGNLTVGGTSPGGGGGDVYWTSTAAGVIQTTGSIVIDGAGNNISGLWTTVLGSNNTGTGTSIFVHGAGNTANATASHAEGGNTIASGLNSHAEGVSTTALGYGSHSEGGNTEATSDYSHAEGYQTTGSGISSHAEGIRTVAAGQSSHAEGLETLTLGFAAHSEGYLTTASGDYSHSEGFYSLAAGDFSHAMGDFTVASGSSSLSVGVGTIASGTAQVAFGKYNKRNNSNSLFVIGNGIGDPDIDRRDIFYVNQNSIVIGSGNLGQDVFLFVSGSSGSKGDSSPGVALFMGDVVISGALHGGSPLKIATQTNIESDLLVIGNAEIDSRLSLFENAIQGSGVVIDLPTTNSIIFSSQGSSRTYGGTSNAIISSDASSIRNTSGDPSDVKTNTIISNLFSEIDGDSAINQTLNNAIIAGGINKIDSGSQYNAIVGSGGTFISSGALFNGSLAAGDVYGSFSSPTVFDNAAGSAIIAGGPNAISSSDGNTVVNSAIIGSNWIITSSFTYAIGDTINAAQVLISASNGVDITGQTKFFTGLSGSLTQLTNGTPYLIAGTGIQTSTGSNGAVTISTSGSSGLATGKQYLAPYTATTSATTLAIGQFSWVPADYTGLTEISLRAIMSTGGTANHTGSLQVYNLTSGSYLDLLDTPSVSKHFVITSSIPTLVTSSNLLTGITNFDNSSTAVYEVRVSGSSANNTFIGGVELVFS